VTLQVLLSLEGVVRFAAGVIAAELATRNNIDVEGVQFAFLADPVAALDAV
jgi:hypothetical protein